MSNPEGGKRGTMSRRTWVMKGEHLNDRPDVEWHIESLEQEDLCKITCPKVMGRSKVFDYMIWYLAGCGVLANIYMLYYIIVWYILYPMDKCLTC
jgi:hypothetical protein